MVLPALLVGVEAIRSNRLERRALDALGESMARTRTYAELETAMFDQGEIVWRYLSGLDPGARREFELAGEVVAYWQGRWRGGARPGRGQPRRWGRWHPDRDPAGVRARLQPGRFGAPPGGVHPRAAGAARPAAAGAHADEPRGVPAGAGVERARRLRTAGGDPRRRRPHAAGHHRAHAGRGTCRLLGDLPRPHPAHPRPHRRDGGGWLGQARSSGHADLAGRDRRAGAARSGG